MTEATVAIDRRIFAKALELLGPNGENWTKKVECLPAWTDFDGTHYTECYCLEGAVCKALGLDPREMYDMTTAYGPYCELLTAAVRQVSPRAVSPAQWQDKEVRTFDEVRKVLLDLAFPNAVLTVTDGN